LSKKPRFFAALRRRPLTALQNRTQSLAVMIKHEKASLACKPTNKIIKPDE